MRIFLLVIGLILGIVGSEIIVRVTGVAPELELVNKGRFRLSSNMKLGWELIPHLDYKGKNLEFWDYREKSNRLGFRDREHNVEKPKNVVRILVLGDSISAGHHVAEFKDTYPALLESTFRREGKRVEVLNFSVPGYNTGQELELLKSLGLQYQPDVVILSYCLNDREGMFHGVLSHLLEIEQSKEGISKVRLNSYLSRSELYRFFYYRVLPYFIESKDRYPTFKQYDNTDPVERSLRELRQLSEKHNFLLTTAIFPFFNDLHNYAYHEQHSFVKKLCEELEIPYIDLLETLRSCEKTQGRKQNADLSHPNKYGHKCAAEAIIEHLRTLQIF